MERENYLRVTLAVDSDWTCELFAGTKSSGFAGHGSAWFDLQEVTRFANELLAFPLPENNPPCIEGGYWSQQQPRTLEQMHLSIRAYPIGARGQVGVRVQLADPPRSRDQRPETQDRVEVEIQTSYTQLEQFAKDLILLASTQVEEAVLQTECLA